MNKYLFQLLTVLTVALFAVSCTTKQNGFFSDKTYAQQVKSDFEKRKLLVGEQRKDALFAVFNRADLSQEEKEALEFLYAYMPLCDLSDYDGEFFLSQVRTAFAAREYFDWGKKIPESIFRHFVLVYRINNENLDSARIVFFNELKDRVKGMSMEQAVLEVNHWCHEKANYRGTDGRTSSPLALVRTSWGRCGEESTFTTTAMRAVGIPARQCYTPRWAHTDDNHAWVEVWIDGEWHYIGACEPEAVLDAAWFSAPAKRAMMVHTNVFGRYDGVEAKNVDKPLYSTINLLSNYTQTRNIKVVVVDAGGKAVENAKVGFNVYNYAEYYPIVESQTDAQGSVAIQSGMGDLLIWASKDGVFGYSRSTPKSETVTVELNKKKGDLFEDVYELVPPPDQPVNTPIPAELAEANGRRHQIEDSIRKAYINTFITEEEAKSFASSLNLNPDEAWKYLNNAQGNWGEIRKFINNNKDNGDLFAFLSAISDKDVRDTPEAILSSHLSVARRFGVKQGTPEDIVTRTVLSPRISTELIRPWRTFFHSAFEPSVAKEVQQNVEKIVQYVKKEIRVDDEENYYNCPQSPRGVYEMKIADKRSRNIFFVALCRSAGIAARLHPATTRPQYYDGEWKNADFGEDTQKLIPQGEIAFTSAKTNVIKPQYSTHYTLARFQDGNFVTLRLRGNNEKISVDAGYYRLMTGSRASDGSITIHNKYFEIKEKESLTLEIKIPDVINKVQVLGIVDMNTKVSLTGGVEKSLKDLSNGKGLMLCFADPDKEPTKHVLQDLPAQQSELNAWNGGVLFLVPDDKMSAAFDSKVFKNLPKNTLWGVDNKRVLLNEVVATMKLNFGDDFPLTLFISDNGGIIFKSQGYTIGIGENIVKAIKAQDQCGVN